MLGKGVTLALTALALMVGLATFIILARGSPLGWRPGVGVGLVLANLSVLLLLGAVLAGRLTRVWVERRRGSAGSRLHVRLVFLFSGVAVAPTIVVACFAVAFFHFGIQLVVQRSGARLAGGIAAGIARLSGRTPQQYPRGGAGNGERPGACRALSVG